MTRPGRLQEASRYALPVAAVLMLGLAMAPAVHSQEALPGLVGTWALSVAESDFGSTAVPDSVIMVIERADDRLVMRRHYFSQFFSEMQYFMADMPTDGGTYDATTQDGAQAVTVSWDGAELVMVTPDVESNVGPIEVTERMSADDDGRMLVINHLMDVPGIGPMKSMHVFLRRVPSPRTTPTNSSKSGLPPGNSCGGSGTVTLPGSA